MIPEVEFGVEIDGCIEAKVGAIIIGWIAITEGGYTPMYYDFQRFQQRTWRHPVHATLAEAKAWIREQWEETKHGLLG